MAQREEALGRHEQDRHADKGAMEHVDGIKPARRPSSPMDQRHQAQEVTAEAIGRNGLKDCRPAGCTGEGEVGRFDSAHRVQYPAIARALEAHARRAGTQSSTDTLLCKALAVGDTGEDEIQQEEFDEMDEMQDWMAAMEFQMQEIDF